MKKLFSRRLCFLSAVVFLLSVAFFISAPFTVFADSSGSKGDINGDGVIVGADFELLRYYFLGMRKLSESQLEQADINNDGVVDIEDLNYFPRVLPVVYDIPTPGLIWVEIPEGKGDINDDGVVDYLDTVLFKEALLGMRKLSESQFEQADINNDGELDRNDFEAFPRIPRGTVFGDINNSDTLDSFDLALFKAYLLGMAEIEPDPQKKYIWDANADGNINSIDYAMLKRYFLGILIELPIQMCVEI